MLKLEYEKSVKYLFAMAMFLFVYVMVFADKIIFIIYGTGYSASIITLQTLIFVLPIIFITYLFGNLLGAINKQRVLLIITCANALLNIILNLILIPKYSYLGASVATVITEALGFSLMIYYISKTFHKISIINNLFKTIVVSTIVLIIIYYLNTSINWIVVAVIGFFVYALLLYLFGIINRDDIEIIKQMV
jgi:O-antigen/teichoic acid export membrane protein